MSDFLSAPPRSARQALLGSVALFGLVLLVNACSSSQPTRTGPEPAVVEFTVQEQGSRAAADSAEVLHRQTGNALEANSSGRVRLTGLEPALHLFKVDGYGLHDRRHISVLLSPEDSSTARTVRLQPMRLRVTCRGRPALYRSDLQSVYGQDSSGVKMELTNLYAEDGKVFLQPVIVNELPIPIYIPDNLGKLGHFSVRLYDRKSNPIPFQYADAPPDDGHRIYSNPDVLQLTPQTVKRLSETELVVDSSVVKGEGIYGHMRYTFSIEDTLRASSATTFPQVTLDSLRDPRYDTLRISGEIEVPDSLVVRQDTSRIRTIGIDTVVTRRGYTLYSTFRDSNVIADAQTAASILRIPDTVKTRARQDSLEQVTDGPGPAPDSMTRQRPVEIVFRTDRSRLDSLITNPVLVNALRRGLPPPGTPIDSVLSQPDSTADALLKSPTFPMQRTRRGLQVDTAAADSTILSALPADSLPAVDTLDRSLPTDWLAPAQDSLPLDSLPLTVRPTADAVVPDSVIAPSVSTPPVHSYWYVPPEATRGDTHVLVLDPAFRRLRARARIDTAYHWSYEGLVPQRLGQRSDSVRVRPQQIIARPLPGYRESYLKAWRRIQRKNLRPTYCQIFPFPLQTSWRSTAMQ